MKPLLCLAALFLLGGRCQAFEANADEWLKKLIEVRDSYRQVCPTINNHRVSIIEMPFGWMLRGDREDDRYIQLRHVFNSTALIKQENDGLAVRVAWHVRFRRNDLQCVSSHSFNFHLPRNWNQDIQPQISVLGPISNMVKEMAVSWPAAEANRFEAALQTRDAPAVCW